MLDRYKGSIFGLAIGDALGATVEFSTRKEDAPDVEMNGGGVFNLKPGEWTDDTSMALCMAQSIIEKDKFDIGDVATKFVAWMDNGYMSSNGKCFDIGNTTYSALSYFRFYRAISGLNSPANGSLMRLCPIPLAFRENPRLYQIAEESSIITHNNVLAIDACKYYSNLILKCFTRSNKTDILSYDRLFSKNITSPEFEYIIKRSFIGLEEKEFWNPTGYVIDTINAALWAFANSETFEDGLLKAVKLCGDADTVGAIYGQLAGTYYGFNKIPSNWINVIAKKELLETISIQLYEFSKRSSNK